MLPYLEFGHVCSAAEGPESHSHLHSTPLMSLGLYGCYAGSILPNIFDSDQRNSGGRN